MPVESHHEESKRASLMKSMECRSIKVSHSLSIDDNCKVLKFTSHECSGFCKSTTASLYREMRTYLNCCRIDQVEYKTVRLNCYKKPELNKPHYSDSFNQNFHLSSNVLSKSWVPYSRGHVYYEGYFNITYPAAVQCSCRKFN